MGVKVAFRFPAGRYHATPWDRHVNEGEVEWPPSPWRLLRALMATWHRKVEPEQFPESILRRLIGKLADQHPRYRLPPATRFHTRHYMPTGKISGNSERRSLLFDAFVRVNIDDPLIVHWPEVQLGDEEQALLEVLLERLGYLGRAESWVTATLAEESWEDFNCFASEQFVDGETGELLEAIRLAAPQAAGEYSQWRARIISEYGLNKSRLSQRDRRLLATLPESVVDTLKLETSDVQAARWSRMPGMQFVTYQRPLDCLTPMHRGATGTVRSRPREKITSVRLVLAGKPLPRLEDAVRIGEAVRGSAVSLAKSQSDDDAVPWVLSGLNIPEGYSHAHAYYLPEDADGDGRIDHVLVFAAAGFDKDAMRALGMLRNIKFRHRQNEDGWHVVLEGYSSEPTQTGTLYAGASTTWRSATPYLRPWHSKKNFGLQEQLMRECSLMKLPELRHVQVLSTIRVRGRSIRPVHFHRFRSKHGLKQPDTRGTFVELTFAEPVNGPLALGFGSHFGLGLFRPLDL